jgi:hypothetical protein
LIFKTIMGFSTPKGGFYYHYEFKIEVYKEIAVTTLVGLLVGWRLWRGSGKGSAGKMLSFATPVPHVPRPCGPKTPVFRDQKRPMAFGGIAFEIGTVA